MDQISITEPQNPDELCIALHEVKKQLSGVHFEMYPTQNLHSWVELSQEEFGAAIDEIVQVTRTGTPISASQVLIGKILLSALERRILIDSIPTS